MGMTDTKYGLISQIRIRHLGVPFSKNKSRGTTKPAPQKNINKQANKNNTNKNKPRNKTNPPNEINRKISYLLLTSWCHILKSHHRKCRLGTILNAQATPMIRIEHKTSLHTHRMGKFSQGHQKIACTNFLGNCISEKNSPLHDIYHPVAALYQVDKPFHKAKYNMYLMSKHFKLEIQWKYIYL